MLLEGRCTQFFDRYARLFVPRCKGERLVDLLTVVWIPSYMEMKTSSGKINLE